MPDTFLPIIWDRLMSALTALALTGTDWGIALFRLIGFGTEPSGLHVIDADELAGSAFEDAGTRLDTGVPIGIIRVFGSDRPTPRNTHAIVAPAIGTAIESGDQIVVAADRHPGIVAPNKARPPARATALTDFEAIEPPPSRILLIGLSPRLMTLERLASYKQGTAHVVILCPDEEQVAKAGIPNEIVERLGISVWRGDPLNESDLRSALRDVNPDRILLASTYPYDDMRLADAETLLTLFRLRRLTTAETLVHLHFPEDVGSLANDPTLDIIPTTAVRARLLAEAAINFGYLRVYHAIASRAYIHARTVTFHPADGEEHDFATVYRAALENDCVVVGISTGTAPDGRPGVNVAPTPDTTVAPGDLLLVALSNAGEDENAVLESLHNEGVVEKIELEMPGVGSARDTASGE